MNLGLQIAAFVFIWPHLSQTAQIICLVVAIIDFLGGVDIVRAQWPWKRQSA